MPKFFDPVNHPKRSINAVTIYGSVLTITGTATDGTTANIYINGIKNTTILTIAGSSKDTSLDTWITNNYAFYYAKGYVCTKSTTNELTVTPRYSWDTRNRISVTIVTGLTGDISGTLVGVFEPDLNIASTWQVTFGQNITVTTPRNMTEGAKLRLEMHATGSFTATYSACASYRWVGGTDHSQTASGYDVWEGQVVSGFYPRIDTVTLAGTTGTANITAGGVTKLATFNGSLNTTCTDFVTAWVDYYAAVGLTVAATGGTANPLIFTATTRAANFHAPIRVIAVSAGLSGTVVSVPEGKMVVNYVSLAVAV